jgi:hypothetical protein
VQLTTLISLPAASSAPLFPPLVALNCSGASFPREAPLFLFPFCSHSATGIQRRPRLRERVFFPVRGK